MAFPQMWYKSNGRSRIVASQAERDALIGTWASSPAAFAIVTAPSVGHAALVATATKGVAAVTEHPKIDQSWVTVAVKLKADGFMARDAKPSDFIIRTTTRRR